MDNYRISVLITYKRGGITMTMPIVIVGIQGLLLITQIILGAIALRTDGKNGDKMLNYSYLCTIVIVILMIVNYIIIYN